MFGALGLQDISNDVLVFMINETNLDLHRFTVCHVKSGRLIEEGLQVVKGHGIVSVHYAGNRWQSGKCRNQAWPLKNSFEGVATQRCRLQVVEFPFDEHAEVQRNYCFGSFSTSLTTSAMSTGI